MRSGDVNATRAVSLAQGYMLRRATLLDMRALHRLERVIFPRDAYPYLDLAALFLWPGVINLKIAGPDGTLAGFASCSRGLLPERGWIITLVTSSGVSRVGVTSVVSTTSGVGGGGWVPTGRSCKVSSRAAATVSTRPPMASSPVKRGRRRAMPGGWASV
jgi:hypothetical protein